VLLCFIKPILGNQCTVQGFLHEQAKSLNDFLHSGRMVKFCLTFLVFAWVCSKTLHILPTHSYSTSYAACWKSVPAHVSPDVAFFCLHNPHRHVMRSVVATLVSMPRAMPPNKLAYPVWNVTRSGSECLIKSDPRIHASLSLVILQSGPANPKRRSWWNHNLFSPDTRWCCQDHLTKSGCH